MNRHHHVNACHCTICKELPRSCHWALITHTRSFYVSLHQNWADMLLKCKHQGSSAPFAAGQRIRTICSWAETSEALLFHGLQAAGSEPKAAKVDEGWLESRSASSVSAPAGALWRRVVGLLRYGGQQQKQVVVCWGGGGLEPSGSQSERAGLGQQAGAALHQRRGGVKS